MIDEPARMNAIAPLPPGLPDDARRGAGVIVVGGTFDPPHAAHIELAQAARAWWLSQPASPQLAWLLFVPAARSPHKPDGPIAGDADRVEMVRLATDAVPMTGVWEDEIARAKRSAPGGRADPSYTVETLERLRAALASACREAPATGRLRLLIGADQAAALHRWRDPRRIITLAPPLILPRAPLDGPERLDSALADTGFWSADERAALAASLVNAPTHAHAATDAREALATGDRDRAGRLLHPAVLSYIDRHGLYRGRP